MRGCAVDQRTQMTITALRVRVARRDGGVLLGFDDKPSAIAMLAQRPDQRREVDRAVARHSECTVDHSIKEAPLTVARNLDDRRPGVLEMNMTNTCDMPGEQIQRRSTAKGRLAAAEGCVSAVEQQADIVASERHQAIDIPRRFNISAHVMV